jgi:hypothetical protein
MAQRAWMVSSSRYFLKVSGSADRPAVSQPARWRGGEGRGGCERERGAEGPEARCRSRAGAASESLRSARDPQAQGREGGGAAQARLTVVAGELAGQVGGHIGLREGAQPLGAVGAVELHGPDGHGLRGRERAVEGEGSAGRGRRQSRATTRTGPAGRRGPDPGRGGAAMEQRAPGPLSARAQRPAARGRAGTGRGHVRAAGPQAVARAAPAGATRRDGSGRSARGKRGAPRTLAALGLDRPLAKLVADLEAMAAIVLGVQRC